jgi:hypothetical protein
MIAAGMANHPPHPEFRVLQEPKKESFLYGGIKDLAGLVLFHG